MGALPCEWGVFPIPALQLPAVQATMKDRWFTLRIYDGDRLLAEKRVRTYDEDMPTSETAVEWKARELYRDAMHALGLWTIERYERQYPGHGVRTAEDRRKMDHLRHAAFEAYLDRQDARRAAKGDPKGDPS
jgi:hypothetical protein